MFSFKNLNILIVTCGMLDELGMFDISPLFMKEIFSVITRKTRTKDSNYELGFEPTRYGPVISSPAIFFLLLKQITFSILI